MSEDREDFDFVMELPPPENLKTAQESFDEMQPTEWRFNPNWDHIRRVVNSGRMKVATDLREDEPPGIDEARGFIGDYVEIVHTRTGAQLLIDESGHLKKLPLNSIASQLYGGPIVGPVLILRGKAKWT
jgi:hypothetical protein